MGLVNAMAIWSRFIDTGMAGMDDFVLCYADDVLAFIKSSKVEDHIADLEKVFQQLAEKRHQDHSIQAQVGSQDHAVPTVCHNKKRDDTRQREDSRDRTS